MMHITLIYAGLLGALVPAALLLRSSAAPSSG